MPHTTHILGVTALSPDLADARQLPSLGWELGEAPSGGAVAPGAEAVAQAAAPRLPVSGSVTVHYLWDGEDILVETDGTPINWNA